MIGRQKVLLTPRYYLDNFQYVLDFVKRLYGGLLNEAEWDFVRRFETLSSMPSVSTYALVTAKDCSLESINCNIAKLMTYRPQWASC
jgi:hypothetical protein